MPHLEDSVSKYFYVCRYRCVTGPAILTWIGTKAGIRNMKWPRAEPGLETEIWRYQDWDQGLEPVWVRDGDHDRHRDRLRNRNHDQEQDNELS